MNAKAGQSARAVLYIDKSNIFGGAEECLLSLMQDIDRQRFQPLLCLDQSLPHHTAYDSGDAAVFYRIPSKSWWSRDFSRGIPVGMGHLQRVLYAIKLRGILKRTRPAIIHLNLYRQTAYIDLFTARHAGAVVIAHVRSLASQVPLSRKVLSQCDGIICTSEIVRREAAGIYPGKNVRCIYDGVDPAKYRYSGTRETARAHMQIASNAYVLSSIAMLHPRKGHDTAIRAMPTILKRFPETVLLIAGGEPAESRGLEQARLRKLADSLGIAAHVRFLGHCSDIAALYAATDIVLALSADGEAFGRVPLEAACAKRPVIATALGATPEIVKPDVTGILVAADDSASVAAAVIRLGNNPAVAADLAFHAEERARSLFSSQTHAENVQAFYEELLQPARSSL